MEKTKQDILRQGNVAHQQAIVEALMPKTAKVVKKVIPGGVGILDLDDKSLESAVYTWLRGVGKFEKATLSLAKDPQKFRLEKSKSIDFDVNNAGPIWETHKLKRQYIAGLITNLLKSQKIVQLSVEPDGLYAYSDPDQKFSPYRKATKADLDYFIEELKEEPPFDVGDQIYSEDFEPYLEFLCKRKGQYA